MISLLGSSLLSMFSGIVYCRLVVHCFISKSHLGMSTCLPFLVRVNSFYMFYRSSQLPRNFKRSLFFPLCTPPLCKCTTISLSIVQWRGCFQVLAMTNNAAIDIFEHLSVWYD